MNKQEFAKIVGQNMKKYRDAHGLTQEKFAEKQASAFLSVLQWKLHGKFPARLRSAPWRTSWT